MPVEIREAPFAPLDVAQKVAGSLIQLALMATIVVVFVIFMLVKQINRFKKEAPPAPPAGPTNEEKLLMEIRDALKDRR